MSSDAPLLSCIMPTCNRRQFIRQAIHCFLAQDYPAKELVVVDDGTDPVADLLPVDVRLRYYRQAEQQTVGAKRNFACAQARGEMIVHWDDDDWSAPWRLRYQAEQMLASGADLCGLARVWFYAPGQDRAWEYVYPAELRPWVYGASLCYRRSFWQAHHFQEIALGEDTRFVWADAKAKIHLLPDPRFLVAVIHDRNSMPKRTADPRYQPKPVAEVEALLEQDARFYRQFETGRSVQTAGPPSLAPRALVTAAGGIGDILRVTPLIRVLHRMHYAVDVLVAADYPDIAALLAGAPEVQRIFLSPSARRRSGPDQTGDLSAAEYDVATYTTWSATLRRHVRSKRALLFERERWLVEGDWHEVEAIARELGWEAELPEPFARASPRHFGLAAGTVALHPGCKYEWPWKKWHGFAELARRFPRVVIVGAEEDLRTDNTYFRHPFAWPEHVQNYIGRLDLPDTAALLSECAALVSNDSGLMHLGVTLGLPTFGIFGLTSPRREAMRTPKMIAVTKHLPCEDACRQGAWGRRDCHRHLECLKSLTPDEVFRQVNEILPQLAQAAAPPVSSPPAQESARETINVIYYGWVFDASGYGQAARGYLHALHRAGINLSVVDLGGRPPAVRDALVESLVGRELETDFHLFHGVPPLWSRHAFPLPNVIAMTVWETDTMPSQWRPVLNHALEVWLPCEFNTSVFGRALHRPVFKLPHPLLTDPDVNSQSSALPADLSFAENDFVFYSIFEWQDRKAPVETMEAFLRAFPAESAAVLVLKANAGAARTAAETLADVRRRVPSAARVLLRCEAWSGRQIAALHARGDAYVSLHRGEGWNLPLFEAACLGKPIVATNFSGPLEYLDPEAHSLVRARPASVRQRYAYYLPSMSWADPDLGHAAELMQRTLAKRAELAGRSTAHAARLQARFSLEAVGDAARSRLMLLLRQTNPGKWTRLFSAQHQTRFRPPVPIPGDWYDADYFENGLKSNWRGGYHWGAFSGLFRETAAFLTQTFTRAQSFLDAGCAKGFLVRALRECGQDASGFDHSSWALSRAEKLAFPHLWQADAASIDCPCPRDVLVALSLFESLTEAQARGFLRRIRPATRQAIFAVIQTDDCRPAQQTSSPDDDLSHISLRPRAFWHDLFLSTGWKQDPLHQLWQDHCQRSALPTRMGWDVYVYSPG